MRDLTQHLTTRADDSHAAPLMQSPKGISPSLESSPPVQTPVRFFALRRIKPHAPPLVRAPVNSFEFQALRPYSPGGVLIELSPARRTILPHTKYPSFTARTTGVSNPVRSPSFSCLSVRCCPGSRLRLRCSSRYLRISPLHREFRFPLQLSSLWVSEVLPRLSRGLSPQTAETAYAPFTPSNSEQRLPPPYYRGCWHGVSRGLLLGYRHSLPQEQEFTTRGPSSSTRRRWVRVSPIAQDSPLLPPVGVWAVSSVPV